MVGGQEELQPRLRERASDILRRLSPPEREALLIKCWMSHDARWFMAAAGECGMETANRLNRTAAREVGKAEGRRIARALQLAAVRTVDDWLLTQEILLAFLGPDLADYQLAKVGGNAFQVHVQRCHAYDNAVRAGISDQYECGMLARITGWLDALGVNYEISPPLGKCLKATVGECLYQLTLRFDVEGGEQGSGGADKPAAGAAS
jgi:hypothetical protein